MTNFKIDDDIPIPRGALGGRVLSEHRRKIIETALQLNVNQSFMVYAFDAGKTDKDQVRAVDSVCTLIRQRCKKAGDTRKFTFRKMPDGSYRIWRVQ